MTNAEYVVELKNVSCKAGYHYLLKDVSWQIKKGEQWVVFGMNGSGKTTLLSIIAGFGYHTAGSVKVFGEEISNENILEIRKRIGWVSASFFDRYYTQESALDIVLSGLNGTLGLDGKETLENVVQAKTLLTRLGLGDRINRTFDTFSKGERQNILIARALISDPEILILDEPCTGLDVYNRSYLFKTIEKLVACKNTTIIYVTHYVEEILPLFESIILMKNGCAFAKGNTDELLNDANLEELLGYPVNVLREESGTYRMDVNVDSGILESC